MRLKDYSVLCNFKTENRFDFTQFSWYFRIMKIADLKNKKILILGLGKEGIDSYLALRKLFPSQVFGIADKKVMQNFDKQTQNLLKKDKNLKLHLGENYLETIGPIRNAASNGVKDYDVIIKTPGISPKALGSFGVKEPSAFVITSQTKIFFDNFSGIIIGVTGTKGKGTTSSLIYSILKEAGIKTKLVGNIGNPVFQLLLKTQPSLQGSDPCQTYRDLTPVTASAAPVFVYELSGHQLQELKKSPCIAVFLNLFTDHLDYYRNFSEYQKAKENIFIHQTKNNTLIYNKDDKLVGKMIKKAKAKKIPFSLKTPLTTFEQQLKKNFRLAGDFNFANLRAALKVAEIFKIPQTTIIKAVKKFRGLPHRLEFIGKYKGIEFYNNSMATIPETTILDLQTFNGKNISLIAGGSDKGSDYKGLAKTISQTSVKNLIILGQDTGQKILNVIKEGVKLLPARKEFHSFQTRTMREAVKICYEKTPERGVCLLSPASASFNLFKDYQDRGNQFKKWVKFYGSR